MKIRDILKEENKTFLSLEFVPPERGGSIDNIIRVMDTLMSFSPSFINITNHPPITHYVEMENGIAKMRLSKRPGTIGLAVAMKYRYPSVEVIPHIVCKGLSKYQLEDLLIELNYLGVENLFVIRGDAGVSDGNERPKDEWKYAKDLVKQISNMNKGVYLYPVDNAVPTNFCVGVAGYPEKHYESLNFEEDIQHLKEKIESGADFVITQMFFDLDVYKRFVDAAREANIDIPIIPGIKPVVSLRSLRNIPKRFFVNIPSELVKSMQEAKTPKEEWMAGIRYMSKLVERLLDYGVPGIHVFTMGHGKSTKDLLKAVFGRQRVTGQFL
ncbi:methylenetetrahydrofolate reductase [Mesoaciditoga lauensis]|uniref:methylenetetrahydrofolate reductase n=1 Tax=Mesoaciditoga lauensis TaxID=1495039 RepID=UPI00055C671E|nr:methylenetetrahydrofolate reductase [Mesoaciditoga lauensis]